MIDVMRLNPVNPLETRYRDAIAGYVADMVRLDRDGDDDLYDPEDGPPALQYQHEILGSLIDNGQVCDVGVILLYSDALKRHAIDDDQWLEILAQFFEDDFDLDNVLREIGYLLIQSDVLAAYESAKRGVLD